MRERELDCLRTGFILRLADPQCRICGEGPCRVVPPPRDLRVPNRLKGAVVNAEGDVT